ncbi:MAG: hypothetical protein M1829_002117 [Trizodia sp. TS-e1964]|nr:MAG: hypothetical protein M1829_002117 [Trizodia sp. TS-e1964]
MTYVSQARSDAANFTLFIFVFFSTVARLLSRWYVSRKFSLEDYFIGIAVAFLFAFTIIIHQENLVTETLYYQIIGLPAGKQELTTLDQLRDFSYFVRLTIFDNSTQVVAVFFAKMSLLAFYRRATVIKKHTIILHCVEAFVTASFIATLIPVFFNSDPVGCGFDFFAYINDPVPCNTRADVFHLIMAGSGFNILIDLIMVILPWFVIPNLQLSRSNKYKLIAMYSLGFITMAASAVRIDGINIEGYDMVPKLEAQFKFDFTSMVEASTAILCVNVPGIFAAVNRFKRGGIKGSSSGSGQTGDSEGNVTIGGGRAKRKANSEQAEDKTEGVITLTHEFTVSDEEKATASGQGAAANPV